MPEAVTLTTCGTVTVSEATERLKLPGTLTRTWPLSRPSTSTWTSRVPSTPVRLTLIPLLDWVRRSSSLRAAEAEAGLVDADRDRHVEHAVLEADVLDPDRRPLERERPSEIVFAVVAPPAAEALTVNVCVSPAMLDATSVVPLVSENAPAANVSVTVPFWNRPVEVVVLVGRRGRLQVVAVGHGGLVRLGPRISSGVPSSIGAPF